MTRPANRRANYRITRRMAAVHRTHANAAYTACVLCILHGRPGR